MECVLETLGADPRSVCTGVTLQATRRDSRHDSLAIALLHILVLYHDVLFSDVEVRSLVSALSPLDDFRTSD